LSESNAQEFNTDLHPHVDIPELPGGSNVGIYLHEVIERLNLQWFKDSPDFGSWSKRTDVNELFRKAFQRNSVRDVRWLELGRELVYNALTSPNDLGMGGVIEPLHSLAPIREMEFIYPIPEKNHPLLGGPDAGSWHAEKGFLKGFVDIVFERGGLVYFADWKSDHLASYDASSVTKHVENNYQLQAQIYSVGVLRLLRIRTQQEYVRRFGGLLYIFLRAFTHGRTPADGVYFHRPDWNSICASESELMSSSARPEFAS
jgi:exodeoxyribonuclease V beta subunit